jgi:osmotically-inducible protein OsmY
LSQKTDARITQDVLDELAFDPAVTVADLNVSTNHGRVKLHGTADTYSTKLEAEEAAYRIGGVSSVDNDIVVNPAALGFRSDTAIAADIRTALALDYQVPDDRISVSVVNGDVTLTGNVNWDYQRDAAEEDVAMIKGVQDVDDEIVVDQPRASAADISSGIARAFARNAELYDDNVDVAINGSQVTLTGAVETGNEYVMAEDIAWMAPGVTSVINNIAVNFP